MAVGAVRVVTEHSAVISAKFATSATGTKLSSTVTVALQVEILLLLSVTVNITVLAPKFAQVKLVGSILNVTAPQASFEPLSISEATILAFPEASN